MIKELNFMGIKITSVCTGMPHGSGVSDSTGNLASNIEGKKAELAERQAKKELVDYALGTLSAPKRLIIETRFMTENIQDKAAFIVLRAHSKRNKWKVMHYRKYEQLRDEALMEIAHVFGDIGNDKVIEGQ